MPDSKLLPMSPNVLLPMSPVCTPWGLVEKVPLFNSPAGLCPTQHLCAKEELELNLDLRTMEADSRGTEVLNRVLAIGTV